MNKFNTKLSAAVAMAAVIAATLAPAAMADTTVTVQDNGVNSTNKVTVNNTNTNTVEQTNETLVVNGVLTISNTGLNSAEKNTGGDTTINTGKATTNVDIVNTGSKNEVQAPDCGCVSPDTTVTVKDNGVNSKNTVSVTNNDSKSVTQGNSSAIINLVGTISNTGLNSAKKNTGGNTTVTTGKVKTKVSIRNTGSSNTLK